MCQPAFTLEDEDGNPVARSTSPTCSSAWIDPTGRFFPVRDCGHSEFAEFHYSTFDLEGRGWVHLSFGNLYYRGTPRQSQVNTLYDALEVGEEHGYFYARQLRSSLMALLRTIDGE